MAITYDAGTNIITVVGYTEAVPCNFVGIYNADVAGGWGVFTRLCTYSFCSTAKLQIGDGSTVTWFKDINKTVNFIGNAAAQRFECRLNTKVQLGEKTSTGGTRYGCTIFGSGAYGIVFVFYDTLKLYRTTFKQVGTAYATMAVDLNPSLFDCVDCEFEKLWSFAWYGVPTSTTLLRNKYSDSNVIMYPVTTTPITIDTMTVYDSARAISAYTPSSRLNVTNLTAIGNTYIADMGNNAILNMYDSTLVAGSIWDRGSGWVINEYYHLDLKVTDKDEVAINGATVKIWDKDSNLVVDTSTGAGGTIAQQTILRDIYSNSLTPTLKTPHLMKIEKAGYTMYEADFTLEEKTDWTIALQTSILRNPSMTGGMS